LPGLLLVAIGFPDAAEPLISYAEAGVVGFVRREASVDEVSRAIDEVAAHGAHCALPLVALLLQHVSTEAARRGALEDRLTSREAEVVRLLGRGYANKEIAHALGIELPTVKNHIHNILEKLHLERRADVLPLVQLERPEGLDPIGDTTGARI
jgi:DNA-binding NarL/FixJ family response regulator